jgi:hypothetical protein
MTQGKCCFQKGRICMKTNKILGIMLLLAFFVGCHTFAQASSGYLTTFNTRYGTSGTALNSCIICHTTASASPSTRNSYGATFGSNAHSYPAIEALDSDNDTFTNLQEIQARTFPGNASSHPAVVTLASIAIQGASSVNASTTSTYTATASYSNGTSKAVTATWSVSSSYATISAAGVLTAGAVTANQSVTVNASYSEGGVTKTAAMSVTIIAPTPGVNLTGIAIQGASSVNASTTSTYTATAAYNDGTSKTVTAVWSLTSPYATISSAGVLTASAVTANQSVTVNASYTEGGGTATATKGVTIITNAPPQGHLLFHDDFSGGALRGSPNWETVVGTWTTKGGRYGSTIGSNNIALVSNVPALDSFEAGRIQSRIMLTNRPGGAKPNASMLFGYVDSTHYRYVRILEHRVVIGQRGGYEGETAGAKAVIKTDISLKTWHNVRVDIHSAGLVNVYVDQAGDDESGDHETADSADKSSPLVSYLFTGSAAGQVGYAAKKARIFFDDFYAWDETVLP